MSSAQLADLARHAAALEAVPAAVGTEAAMTEGLRRLEAAAAARRLVTIDYASIGAGERAMRTVEPYGVVYWIGRWYLVGYCRLRRAMRVFRVDRISSLEEREERFERPEGFSTGEWFARKFMPSAPEDGSATVVRIEGEAGAIDHLARQWFLKPFVTARDRCALELTLASAAAAEHLPGLLLGYGTSLHVASPRELSLRIAELATRVSAFHASGHQ